MISQLNMIADIFASAMLLSFYIPYYCEECDTEEKLLINITEDYLSEKPHHAPIHHCSQCKHEMELEEPDKSYFRFLDDLKWNPPKPEVAELIKAQTILSD